MVADTERGLIEDESCCDDPVSVFAATTFFSALVLFDY
jgi:hypothetical protein